MSTTPMLQITSITTALLSSGGILTLSLFDIPELQSQPATRALPLTRWLFGRGSHVFPVAALLSSTGFALSAYNAVPASSSTFLEHFSRSGGGATTSTTSLFVAATALSASIVPITMFVMLPTNFTLIEMNERLGGARSEKSAAAREGRAPRSAEESVDGKGDVGEWTDLSGPQWRTERGEERGELDEEVRRLLGVFGFWNAVRGVAIGVGGVVGLVAAVL